MSSTDIESPNADAAQLLAQAQQGDADAFGDLCLHFEDRLLRHSMILCGDQSLSQDLTQETLIEAWRCLARYDGTCQLFTWLCAILHNRYRNRRRRKRLLYFFGFTPGAPPETSAAWQQQPDHAASPDQTAQSQESAALVRRSVQRLSPKHQQVVYLRFFVDDSLEGIAAALGCSVGTVKSRLFNALDKLRSMPELREQNDPIHRNVDLL